MSWLFGMNKGQNIGDAPQVPTFGEADQGSGDAANAGQSGSAGIGTIFTVKIWPFFQLLHIFKT